MHYNYTSKTRSLQLGLKAVEADGRITQIVRQRVRENWAGKVISI